MRSYLATCCGILFVAAGALGAEASKQLAQASSAEFVVLSGDTLTRFTVKDRQELADLASLLKTDGKVAKSPRGAPDLDNVIGVIVHMGDGTKTEFAILEGKTLHYTTASGERVFEGLLRTDFAVAVKLRLPADAKAPQELPPASGSGFVLEHLQHYRGDPAQVSASLSIACAPKAQRLFVLTKSSIAGFQCLPGSGEVRFVAASELGVDLNPVQMAMSPDGNHLYVLDVARSLFAVWKCEPDGRLSFLERVPAPVREARRLVFSPDGLHLYAARDGADGAIVLQLDRHVESGKLLVAQELAVQECSALWDLVVTQDAAYAVSFKDKSLLSFRRDQQTGKLQRSDLRKANIIGGFVNPDEGLQDAKRVATTGKHVVVAGDRHLSVFQSDNGRLAFRTLLRDESPTRTSGIHGLIVDQRGTIYLATQNEVRRYAYHPDQNRLEMQASVTAESLGDQLVLAPDGRRMLATSARGVIHVFGLDRFPGRK